MDLRHDPGLARVGNVDDRGTKLLLVREVPEISVMAGDVHLACARQLETRHALDVKVQSAQQQPFKRPLRRQPATAACG
jgi:hypothetical protein